MKQSEASPKGAFTLIELLVVLAIIGLLIALILPAIRGAADSAKTAACANNLRQIYLGIQMYADDHNGAYIPCWMTGGPGIVDTTSDYIWVIDSKHGIGNLYPNYLDDINIFYCPANNKSLGNILGGNDPPSDFGINGKRVPCSYWAKFYFTNGVLNNRMDQLKDKKLVWDKFLPNKVVGPHRKKCNELYGDGSIKLE